jgi:hypothetical protein
MLLTRKAIVSAAVCKILDLPENQEVAVIGTVYKEMKLKPSILNEYNKVRRQPASHAATSGIKCYHPGIANSTLPAVVASAAVPCHRLLGM